MSFAVCALLVLGCVGDGIWQFSQAVNASQKFHVIDGLEPGASYTVRLISKRLLDNASIFEDVIQTRAKGEPRGRGCGQSSCYLTMQSGSLRTCTCLVLKGRRVKYGTGTSSPTWPYRCSEAKIKSALEGTVTLKRSGDIQPVTFVPLLLLSFPGAVGQRKDISTQGWFIGTMCAVAFLTLIVVIACFVKTNQGGKYAGTPPPSQRQAALSMEKGQLALNQVGNV